MKKTKFLAWGGMLFALCAMLTATSCSKSDDENNNNQGNGGGGEVVIPDNGTASATFSGIVRPDGWGILPGVKVTSGDQSVQTDMNGSYRLDRVHVVNGRAVVKFQKEGYMTVVRSVPFRKEARLDVDMKQSLKVTTTTSAPQKLTMGYPEQMTVELPADGFVTETGEAYTGTVQAQSVYLDPDDEIFPNAMPGDLSALRSDGTEAQLVSYGMVAVELTDGAGNKLQLAPGKTATLTFAVPDKFKGTTLPASIPLWSFNEANGLWEEEGAASLNAAGDAYVGTVSHFSWHNLDKPELRAELRVKVLDASGNAVQGVEVNVDGQRKVCTDASGVATCVVPSNTQMTVWVPSEAYGNYAQVMDADGYFTFDETKIVKLTNVVLAPQETKNVTLTMPVRVPVVKGKVTNEGSGTQMCVVSIQYGFGNETAHAFSDAEGNFSLLTSATYRGAATLVAQYGDGYKVTKAITLTDEDQYVTLTANTSSGVTPGVLMVLGNGLNLRYQLPVSGDECWKAVSVTTERGLSLNAYINRQEQGIWGDVSLEIPGYVEGQTSYTSADNRFRYMMEGIGGWTNLESIGTLTVNVTKSGDNYTFKINNANAQLIDRTLGMDWDNAALVQFTVEFTAQKAEANNDNPEAK